METIDAFTCNGCGQKLHAPQGETELPFDWLRMEFYVGDAQGIAQDCDEPPGFEQHFCQTCRSKVTALLLDFTKAE